MSVEGMIESSKLKIPDLPGSYEDRVFIGGNYDFMPLLREIKKFVEEAGFSAIMAFDVKGVPKDKIHDFDIGLLKLCKYAIFEVSTGNGHMMEIEAASKLGTVVFGVYMVRGRRHRKPSPQVSSMLTTIGVPLMKYSGFDELRNIIHMIFPAIRETPDSAWLKILRASWMLPEVRSRLIGQLSMDGLPRVDFVASSLLGYVENLLSSLIKDCPKKMTEKLKDAILGMLERQKSLHYIEEGLSEQKILRRDFGTIVEALNRLNKLPTSPQASDLRCALSIALARLIPSREALEILKRSKPTPDQPVLKFEYHLSVASELYRMDAFDKALSELSKALKVKRVGPEDICRGKLLEAGIWINLVDYKKAVSALAEVLKKSMRIDIIRQARFLRALIWQEKCEYRDALKEYTELLKHDLPSSLELAIRNNKGILHTILGEQQKALRELEKTLKLSKGDKLGMANALQNIGIVLFNLGEYRKALEHHQRALKIHEEIGNKLGMANQIGNIGVVLFNLGEPRKALEHYQRALKLDEEIGNKLGMANDFGSIGNVLFNLGEPRKALEHYQRALKLDEEVGNKLGAAVSFQNIGLLLAATNHYDEALELLNQALKIFKKIEATTYAEKAERNLAIIKENQQKKA